MTNQHDTAPAQTEDGRCPSGRSAGLRPEPQEGLGLSAADANAGPLEYVLSAIALFEIDPADTDYQRGFLAALEVVREEAFAVRVPA
jgi:hypothetical protein